MKNILGIIAVAGLCASFAAARPAYQVSQESKSTISMQSSDGTDTYEVRVSDGKIVAKHNGEVVPEDRVRRVPNGDQETIEILDQDGNVLKSFDLNRVADHMQADGRRGSNKTTRTAVFPRSPKGGFRAIEPMPGTPGTPGTPGAIAPTQPDIMDNPPPVMVGVTMLEPDQSVLEFLKLEKAVVFDRVIDDLPASKAGVKAGDILVEVKGEKNIDQERFRDILRGAKAGDELELKVARAGGEIQTLKISLVAFDSKLLGSFNTPVEDGDKSPIEVYSHGKAHKSWESAQKALEEAMKKLKGNHNLDESVQKNIKESLAQAMESLKEAKESMRDVQIFSNNGQWNQSSPKLRMTPGQNRLMVVPAVPGRPSMPAMNDDRIEKLEQKVDDLNDKLDQIMELLKDRK